MSSTVKQGTSGKAEESVTVSNPNVRPSIPYSKSMVAPLFQPKEPMIARLAKVAARKDVQPTAGWVGIQMCKEPNVDVPPECMLMESDHFKFQLGKMPKHRNYPHESLDAGANPNGTGLVAGMEAMAVSALKETQELAADQKIVKPEVSKAPARGHIRGFNKPQL